LKTFAEKQLAGKIPNLEIVAFKSFKRLQINKRLKVAHLGVAAVEVLKADKAPQRLQIAHLCIGAIKILKACEFLQLCGQFGEQETG
jgi:hypothetical protein